MSAVNHAESAAFAADKVNLSHVTAVKNREQVQGLRDRLKAKIKVDASFDLVKMLHSGSVAKGTALRTVNDLRPPGSQAHGRAVDLASYYATLASWLGVDPTGVLAGSPRPLNGVLRT